jgi:preprotein translocase subunit SecE
MSKLTNYLRDSRDEMVHHVTWPKFSDLQSTSIVVLVASLIFALVIGAMDWVFKVGVKAIYALF